MQFKMIHIALAAAGILSLTAGSAPAQHEWYGGVKLGFNTSQFRGDAVAPLVYSPEGGYYVTGAVQDRRFGFIGGGFIRRDIGSWFSVQLDLLYSQKGGKGPVNGVIQVRPTVDVVYDGVVNGELKFRMDYIEVPLLAIFRFPRDTQDKVGFTVGVGPSVGYNTRAEAQLTGTAEVTLPDFSKRVQNYDERIPIHGNVNRWAVSGVGSAALEFYLAKQTILLEARYQFDVTSISEDQSTYNHSLSLMVGFMTPLTH
jgi:hypothetical protein